MAASSVGDGRTPGGVMGIQVAQDERVTINLVKDRDQVRKIAGLARGRRRNINVKDADVGLVELYLNSLELDVGVIAERHVDGSVGDRVMDEERHPATSTSPEFVDEDVARD